MLIFEDRHALFGFSPGLVQDGFYGVMISCCEQIGLGLERECLWGQWNDGGCWLSRGRNQTPHDISNILFKKVQAFFFFRKMEPIHLFCPKLLKYIHECTPRIFIRGELWFVCNICDVEDFVVKLLLLFLVCQDGVSC